jgi:alpha-L-fucosidase 2
MRLAAVAAFCLTTLHAQNWIENIEYSKPGISLKLDAWAPEGKGPFPTAIIVHGGGWIGGDKRIEWVQPLFEPLQKAGFAIFTINYRLTPQSRYPAMMQDLAAAVRWVKDNAKKYKADKRRIALIGESAGGHMVAYHATKVKDDSQVDAVVDFYGPHDLLLLAKERDRGSYQTIARNLLQEDASSTTEWKLREASPMEYVRKGMPPILFIHGTTDAPVPVNQSSLMCEKMKAAGAACEVLIVEGAPHGISNWEKTPAFQAYKPRMIEWLRAQLK